MKKIVTSLFFAFLFSLLFAPKAEAKNYDYTIESYHVDMKVTKQNTYQIIEKIKVNFNEYRHGIYRDIPLDNKIKRADGSSGNVMAKIKNIYCSDDYSSSRESNSSGSYCRLKIGDEDTEIIGEKEYTISYDYVMGNDILEGNDELYFNIIGTSWSSPIRNVTFAIQMPETFDEKKLGMCYGGYGQELTEGLYYGVEGNTIHGQLDSSVTLKSGEGLSVRLLLPDGYFDRVGETPVLPFIAIFIALIGAVLGALFWWKYGRDDEVIEVIEFYPPDGLNSLELAFANKGSVDNQDVISLLVYLAQKGYLKISEQGKHDFVIEKIKDYDGFIETERIFMEGLFSSGDIVSKGDLKNSFYKTINDIMARTNTSENRKKLFYANSLNKGWMLWLLSILSFVFVLFKPASEYEFSIMFGVIISVLTGVVSCALFHIPFGENRSMVTRILGLFAIIIAFPVAYLVLLQDMLTYFNMWYTIAFWCNVIACGITMFFSAYMSKRTPYGNQILGRIRGFRNFLNTAEKEKLEQMVMDDPEYFYEILPYTYVLDLSDKWMDKFESITVEPPHWYYGNDVSMFDMMMFHRFMNSTMTQATTSMTSAPSSSGGGGFSGGGAGGGGGGSW